MKLNINQFCREKKQFSNKLQSENDMTSIYEKFLSVQSPTIRYILSCIFDKHDQQQTALLPKIKDKKGVYLSL